MTSWNIAVNQSLLAIASMETDKHFQPADRDNTLVVIPAFNEEKTIGSVVRVLKSLYFENIRVVDNASTDATAERAREAGAAVFSEPKRGYGKACRTGYENVAEDIEWIFFCDADGSDDLAMTPEFLRASRNHSFVLGNRRWSTEGRNAMTVAQNLGNGLATSLIRFGWGFHYYDLGPMRLIRCDALEKINMRDRNYGWTVEMQIRAIEEKLSIYELEVGYYPRKGGRSKISGTVSGTLKAGSKILWTILLFYLRRKFAGKNRISR